MVQMLICFSFLRFYTFGVRDRGRREGPTVAKMVNTDNPHPQGTVCPSVSGPLFNRIISLKKTAGLVTIAHFSQLSPGALTVMTNGAGIIWGSGESRRKFLRRRLGSPLEKSYLLQSNVYCAN